jgi:hypothetical protein
MGNSSLARGIASLRGTVHLVRLARALLCFGVLAVSPTARAQQEALEKDLKQWNEEAKVVKDRKAALEKQIKELQDAAASLQTATAKQLAQSQADELSAQIAALGKIADKYQEIIDLITLLPKLSGKTRQTAMETLGRLQQELAALRAGTVVPLVPVGTPPGPSPPAPPPTPPTTGTLVGVIKDEDGKRGVPNAVVLVRCRDNGNYQATTRTDALGEYVFTNLPQGDCLVRAAKYLSPEENEEAKREFKKLEAENLRSIPPKGKAWKDAKKQAQLTARRELSPEHKAYQERTLKPLTITAGQTALATSLRLEPRTASVGEFARAIVGFEQTGASAAASAQKFFFDLWLSVPAPFLAHAWKDPNFGPSFRFWGDVRVSSVPQQITSSLGDFAVRFSEQVGALKVNEVAQSSEFLAGGEARIFHWGVSKSRLLSFDQTTRERFGMYLVLGGGTSTPLNPRDTLQVFGVPPPGSVPAFDQAIKNLGLTDKLMGKQFVAFASQDRDKFFRQYYVGIRLKTFYYDRDTDEPLRRFPATLDILVGQNEAVTGGRLHRAVLRLEGFYPLPFNETKDVYLFGTAEMIPGRPNISDAIILQPAPASTPVPAVNVLLISTPQLNRDHYRLGVGIDVLSVIQHIKERNANNPSK